MTSDEESVGREAQAQAAATRSRRHTLDELTQRFAAWLGDRLCEPSLALGDVRHPAGAGTSSETVLATATWRSEGSVHRREVAFRLHPDGFQLYRDPDFELQYKALKVLHREQLVPVPEPLFYEPDTTVIGLPFFVMEQVHGRVPVSSPHYNTAGFLFDATPRQRRRAWKSAIGELARMAKVPLDLMPFLDRPQYGKGGLEQELAYWHGSLEWACDGEIPDYLLLLDEWLRSSLPDHRPDGLSWGDSRLGNVAFDDEFEVAALFDWEQVGNGGSRQDLGWWLLFDRYMSDGLGLERLDGFGTRDETIALWEGLTGEDAGDLSWYEALAAYKLCVVGVRAQLLMGNPDARSAESMPIPRMAFEYAGLPFPS